jgi:hypothetical protein
MESQWENIAGAANSTYTLTGAENGKTITLVVSFSGNTGSLTSAATAAVQPAKEALQGTVAILGTAKVGEMWVADISGLTNSSGSVSYQWKRGGQDIAGAAGVTYTLTNADKGTTITVTVSYSGNSGKPDQRSDTGGGIGAKTVRQDRQCVQRLPGRWRIRRANGHVVRES